MKPLLKAAFYRFHFQVLSHWGTSFEICHMFINTLLRFVWKYYLKWSIQVTNGWSNLIAFICFVLFCVVGKVKVLQNFFVSCSCEDILKAIVTYQIFATQYIGLLGNWLTAWCYWNQWKLSFPRHWWQGFSRFVSNRVCFVK